MLPRKIKLPALSTLLLSAVLITTLVLPDTGGWRGLLYYGFAAYMAAVALARRQPVRMLHLAWVVAFWFFANFSREWAVDPAGVDQFSGHVLFSMLLSWSCGQYSARLGQSVARVSRLMVYMGVLLMVNVVLNFRVAEGRLSMGTNANTFGMIAAHMFNMALYHAKSRNMQVRWLNVLLMAFAVVVLLSGSRKALVMLVMFGMAQMFFSVPDKNMAQMLGRMLLVLLGAIVALVILMRIPMFYNTIGHRIVSLIQFWMTGEQVDGSAFTRNRMITMALELFVQSPWLGHGMNNFKYMSAYFTYSHNNYTELLSGLGLVGTLIYYVPLVIFTVQAIRLWLKRVPGAIVPLSILIANFFSDWGNVSYCSTQEHIIIGIAIGMIYRLNSLENGPYRTVKIRIRRKGWL